MKYGKEFRVFMKACHHYGLLKDRSQKDEAHKDALVIGNNLNVLDF